MSANGKEYELAIRISGIVDKNFNTSLVGAQSQLGKFKATISAMDSDFTKLDKGFDSIMKTGQKCFSVIATAAGVATVAIAAATAGALAVGIEFESAFTGVKKTVEATEAEYEILRQDIRNMAKEIPSSHVEIAGVMEMAGQLGIAQESLSDFTEVMINLGVSTNMVADDAATALAKFANVTNMLNYDETGVSNYERLGSVIVDLGNNFATTEQDIVDMATNIAATGDMVGLSQAQIMALATAMSATGIKAEKGGTAMSKLLRKMQLAVETESDILGDYAAVAGMTKAEFAESFEKDAVVALSAFIDGLDNTERNGMSAVAVLDEMGLSEVRLSDVILRLANSEGIMSDAIEMANKAWEENTALQVEAEKRYATTESQLTILKNNVKDLGITAYDELQGPFVRVLSNITDKVNGLNEKLGGANGISKWIKDIGIALPTLQRKVKTAWKVVSPFFEGLLKIGKWFLKNPEVIVGAIAGIGTALVTYKVASTLTHFVKAIMSFTSMNPATLAILGVVAALSALAAGVAAYKTYRQGLVDKSLEEHFGNIALSMEDIQKIAEYIVSSDSLGGVKEALEAFEDLDGFSATMEDTISEINKMNWKVSIGMEMTPDEQETYKTTIAEYVTAAQEYALQTQYAVSLNLDMAISDEDLEGQNIVDKVNQFYSDKYDELSALGTKLNKAVTDAFNDGLLDVEEVKAIANIQAEMAAVQEALATSEFEARMSLFGMKYANGASLDAESFQNLQAEIANQIAESTKAFDEAYVYNKASVENAYKDGALTYAEYQTALSKLEENYQKNVGDMQIRANKFMLDTIQQVYGDEISEFTKHMEGVMAEYNDEYYLQGWKDGPVQLFNTVMQDVFNNSIDKGTKGAIAQLLDVMQPSVDQLRQLYADEDEMPDEARKLLADITTLGAMTVYQKAYGQGGDMEALQQVIMHYIVNNEDFQEVEDILRGYEWELPDEVADNIEKSAATTIAPMIDGMYAYTNDYLGKVFAQGFDVSTNIRFNSNLLYPWQKFNMLLGLDGINNRAGGGLATRPELTWFAEKGPEMAIPIDGSQNAISLWEQTGRLLGMDSVLDGLDLRGGGSAPSIEYKPTLQFYGAAPNQRDLESALKLSQDEFEVMMRQWLKDNSRVAF